MSITLSAYPMAFLINPEEAKNEKIMPVQNKEKNKSVATKNLKYIEVHTNLEYSELGLINRFLECKRYDASTYILHNGLRVEWKTHGQHLSAKLYGNMSSHALQECGEEFFTKVDAISNRNVRLIGSYEYFYYNYATKYTDAKSIYDVIKQNKTSKIISISNDEIIANVDNQNIKYHRGQDDKEFLLELEQKIKILNIGKDGQALSNDISQGLRDLSIKTNISTLEELKTLLKHSKYGYYRDNGETPLKNSNATLNWVKRDGYYHAEFSGSNNQAILKEAEIIFKRMNAAAKRDIRLIDNMSTLTYTYNTNYTDKSVLLNTLTEHGAENISEDGGNITCKLFGMDMLYHKTDESGAYILDIVRVTNLDLCENVIGDLNEEYGLNIQEMTYNKIKERLDDENLRLESESVLEDNSIVLTIEV